MSLVIPRSHLKSSNQNASLHRLSLRRKNRGQFFGGFIVLVTTIALVIGLIRLISVRDGLSKELGDDQIALLQAYADGEARHLYLDLAVRQSSAATVPDFLYHGFWGGCAEEDGLRMWSNGTTLCLPTNGDISLAFRAIFAADLNSRLSQFKSAPSFKNVSSADLQIVADRSRLEGLPLHVAELSSSYHVLDSFSQEIPASFFMANTFANLIETIDARCSPIDESLEESRDEGSALQNCVAKLIEEENARVSGLNQSDTWEMGVSCESDTDRAQFLEVLHAYNSCARSFDTDCVCSSEATRMHSYLPDDYLGNTRDVSYLGAVYHLTVPLSEDSASISAYVKQDERIVGTSDPTATSSLPLCRLHDRSFKICYTEKNEGKNSPPLRFGLKISDHAAPQDVVVSATSNGYTWNASRSADVQEYLIYLARKDHPFALAGEPDARISRASRAGESLSYSVDSATVSIAVIPQDYAENRAR